MENQKETKRIDLKTDILHNGGLENLTDYTVFKRRFAKRENLPTKTLSDWYIQLISNQEDKSVWICLVGIYKNTLLRTSQVVSVLSSTKVCTKNCIYILGPRSQVANHPIHQFKGFNFEKKFESGFPNNWEKLISTFITKAGLYIPKFEENTIDIQGQEEKGVDISKDCISEVSKDKSIHEIVDLIEKDERVILRSSLSSFDVKINSSNIDQTMKKTAKNSKKTTLTPSKQNIIDDGSIKYMNKENNVSRIQKDIENDYSRKSVTNCVQEPINENICLQNIINSNDNISKSLIRDSTNLMEEKNLLEKEKSYNLPKEENSENVSKTFCDSLNEFKVLNSKNDCQINKDKIDGEQSKSFLKTCQNEDFNVSQKPLIANIEDLSTFRSFISTENEGPVDEDDFTYLLDHKKSQDVFIKSSMSNINDSASMFNEKKDLDYFGNFESINLSDVDFLGTKIEMDKLKNNIASSNLEQDNFSKRSIEKLNFLNDATAISNKLEETTENGHNDSDRKINTDIKDELNKNQKHFITEDQSKIELKDVCDNKETLCSDDICQKVEFSDSKVENSKKKSRSVNDEDSSFAEDLIARISTQVCDLSRVTAQKLSSLKQNELSTLLEEEGIKKQKKEVSMNNSMENVSLKVNQSYVDSSNAIENEGCLDLKILEDKKFESINSDSILPENTSQAIIKNISKEEQTFFISNHPENTDQKFILSNTQKKKDLDFEVVDIKECVEPLKNNNEIISSEIFCAGNISFASNIHSEFVSSKINLANSSKDFAGTPKKDAGRSKSLESKNNMIIKNKKPSFKIKRNTETCSGKSKVEIISPEIKNIDTMEFIEGKSSTLFESLNEINDDSLLNKAAKISDIVASPYKRNKSGNFTSAQSSLRLDCDSSMKNQSDNSNADKNKDINLNSDIFSSLIHSESIASMPRKRFSIVQPDKIVRINSTDSSVLPFKHKSDRNSISLIQNDKVVKKNTTDDSVILSQADTDRKGTKKISVTIKPKIYEDKAIKNNISEVLSDNLTQQNASQNNIKSRTLSIKTKKDSLPIISNERTGIENMSIRAKKPSIKISLKPTVASVSKEKIDIISNKIEIVDQPLESNHDDTKDMSQPKKSIKKKSRLPCFKKRAFPKKY